MARWIRWTTKTGTSLWHRATPATTLVHTRRTRVHGGWAIEKVLLEAGDLHADPPVERLEPSPSLVGATVYRRTACGFVVPPYERIEEWEGLPPLPRCIWCVHGWVVDTSPPSGRPPAQRSGGGASIVIRTRGKKPPTQHA